MHFFDIGNETIKSCQPSLIIEWILSAVMFKAKDWLSSLVVSEFLTRMRERPLWKEPLIDRCWPIVVGYCKIAMSTYAAYA